MKSTRLIALLLAILTASSMFACNKTEEGSTTTTADNSTTPAVTTTKAPDADTTTAPEDPEDPETPDDPGDVEEKPVTGPNITSVLAMGSDLRDLVTDPTTSENLLAWGDGAATQAFDGNTTTTKLGGDIIPNADGNASIDVTWKTSAATTVSAYVLYTGNDSKDWPGRTPLAWEFSGSNDGENWTVIDSVTASGMTDENATPFGYTVDTPTAYTNYKITFSKTTNTTEQPKADNPDVVSLFQLNEIVLIGTTDGEADTPKTEAADLDALKAMGSDLTAHVDQESLKTSASMTPWDDGAPTQMFDGNTTTTKFGGDVVNTAYVTWKTDVATTIKSYILYTGNDSKDWPGRTPISWVLYGSNNNGVSWTVIDRVVASGMVDENATPFGYTVDEPTAYKNYKLHIYTTSVTEDPQPDTDVTTLLQINELILIGDAAE